MGMEDPKKVKGGFTGFSFEEGTPHSQPHGHTPLSDSPHSPSIKLSGAFDHPDIWQNIPNQLLPLLFTWTQWLCRGSRVP